MNELSTIHLKIKIEKPECHLKKLRLINTNLFYDSRFQVSFGNECHFILGRGVHVVHSFNSHLHHLEVEMQLAAVALYRHALAPRQVQVSCSDVHP